jgi:uncharacterized membrane protein
MSAKNVSGSALIVSAMAALLSNSAMAQVHPEKPTYKYEKCYGIARAGHNDCFFASNSCAGTASQDNDPQAWVYVPQGTCKKVSGGALEPPKER